MKWFRSWKTPLFDLKTGETIGEASELVNVYPARGVLKAVYFKTFRGMISELKQVNKACKKYKSRVEIKFTLPIKW